MKKLRLTTIKEVQDSSSYLKINGNMLNRPNVKLMFEILAKNYLPSLESNKNVFVSSKF